MFCRYCGKKIESDSIFCKFCGKKLKNKKNTDISDTEQNTKQPQHDGTYTAPDGVTYIVKDRIMYDEKGYNVGRVPEWWGRDW